MDEPPGKPCAWSKGSERQRFYRPDWANAPDCGGCESGCATGDQHRCHVFGLPGFCTWPAAVRMGNYDEPFWRPATQAGLAESWLESGEKTL